MPAEAAGIGTELWPALRRLDRLLGRALERSRDIIGAAPGSDPFRGLYLGHDDVARSLAQRARRGAGRGGEPRSGELGGPLATPRRPLRAVELRRRPARDRARARDRPSLRADLRVPPGRRHPAAAVGRPRAQPAVRLARTRSSRGAFISPPTRRSCASASWISCRRDPRAAAARAAARRRRTDPRRSPRRRRRRRRCAAFTSCTWPERGLDGLRARTCGSSEQEPRRATAGDAAAARAARTARRRTARGRRGGRHQTSLPLVTVDLARTCSPSGTRTQAVRLVFRERWLAGRRAAARRRRRSLRSELEPPRSRPSLARDAGVVVLASREPWHPPRAGRATRARHGDAAPPERTQARWAGGGRGRGSHGGRPRRAGRALRADASADRGGRRCCVRARRGSPPRADLFAAARAQSAAGLGDARREARAERIAGTTSCCPRTSTRPAPRALRRGSRTVGACSATGASAAGCRAGRGATALFAGPSGTGKTLAAEVIAGELGLDLYRIDLSGVVSKYIGETEKNLDRDLRRRRATRTPCCSSTRRTRCSASAPRCSDAHDRYANIEISYLLQKMEAYDGVAILATNLRDNLDEAFTRRLAFIVNFPFPEDDERRRIWESVWPAERRWPTTSTSTSSPRAPAQRRADQERRARRRVPRGCRRRHGGSRSRRARAAS